MKNKKAFNIAVGLIITILYLCFGILGFPESDQMDNFANLKISYYIIGILLMFILTVVYFPRLKEDWQKAKDGGLKLALKTLMYLIVGYISVVFLRFIIISIVGEEQLLSSGSNLIIQAVKSFPVYVLFVTIFYTPYVEEIIFRKTFSSFINNKYLYIIISALAFGYLHIAGDATSVIDFILLYIPPAFFGGLLAYCYKKTETIFVPITIHMLYNLLPLLITIFYHY